jgi:hypothetical protein
MAVRVEPGARLRRVAFRSPFAAVCLLYLAAAAAATWPGLRTLGSQFVTADSIEGHGEPGAGDHQQTVYRLWLVGHQLERGEPPWVDPYSFQPVVEPQTVLGGWPFGPLFWPLEALFGPVLAWNLLLLGTVVVAGLLTYAWLAALQVRPAGAIIGGLAFAIAPYRLEQSGGHLLGWVALLLPLTLLALEGSRAAETRRGRDAWGAVAALALVSIPLSGQLHLALGVVPLVLAYAAVRYRPGTAAWSLAGALAAVGIGALVRFTLIAGSPEAGGRSLAEVEEFQAEWSDLVSRRQLGGSEDFVFLGWLTPLLALAGLVLLLRRERGLALLFGVAALGPVVLALGTNTPIYSPIWHALPPLRFPRVPERLLPIADLALAALAAIAVAWLVARAGRRAPAAAGVLLVAVALDLAVLPLGRSSADPGNAAYAALADAPPASRLELPILEPGIHYGSVYDYYELQAQRGRPNGYSTLAPERAFSFADRYDRLSCGVWLPGDRERLAALGVAHVLYHRGLYGQAGVPSAWFAWRGLGEAGYRVVTRGNGVTLFVPGSGRDPPAPVPEPPRDRPLFCEGWRGRTMSELQAPLWVYGAGPLTLGVAAPGQISARVRVDGGPTHRLDVAGRGTATVALGPRGWHSVVLEVPRLFPGNPPRGLRLVALRLG